MNTLKKVILAPNSSMLADGVYTFDFSLAPLDAERDVKWETTWSALPSVNQTFKTLPVYMSEEEAKEAADRFLDRQLAVALAAGYKLIVAPTHIADEHHEYCAFCHVRAKMDAPSICLKVRLHPIVPDFDGWMF
ncbi:MAG: hypothetical protein IJI35_17830 [Kiritimatiellae bacterium]|nr:hypothetical protein [Kiritimatiellia bacterium]